MPRRNTKIIWLTVLLMGTTLLVLAVACKDHKETTATPTGVSTSPSVTITSLTNGETILPGNLLVDTKVIGFNIVNKFGKSSVEGEGHAQFYLLEPLAEVPTTPGQPAVTPDANTHHAEARTFHIWPDVQAGTFKVAVQLVNNNDTPLTPPVVDEIQITVKGEGHVFKATGQRWFAGHTHDTFPAPPN